MGLLLGQVSKWRAQRADGGAHAARGFVGGATGPPESGQYGCNCFNAARGFVGGATILKKDYETLKACFNAARGYFLSPPPPLRGPPPPLTQGRLG